MDRRRTSMPTQPQFRRNSHAAPPLAANVLLRTKRTQAGACSAAGHKTEPPNEPRTQPSTPAKKTAGNRTNPATRNLQPDPTGKLPNEPNNNSLWSPRKRAQQNEPKKLGLKRKYQTNPSPPIPPPSAEPSPAPTTSVASPSSLSKPIASTPPQSPPAAETSPSSPPS